MRHGVVLLKLLKFKKWAESGKLPMHFGSGVNWRNGKALLMRFAGCRFAAHRP